MERLDKVLTHHGFGSRKEVKVLLKRNHLTVNGLLVRDPGYQIDILKDSVELDGEKLKLQRDLYIMMNKCQNVVCANKDGEHQTVFDLIDDELRHKFLGGELHCMGRLDIDTEGLLLLTTDGKLTHRLLSPKTHAPKTYAVGLEKSLSIEEKKSYIEKFSKGFWIDREMNETGFECQPSELIFIDDENDLKSKKENYQILLEACNKNASGKVDCILTIFEGKFHQVKRMFSQLGNKVIYLKRIEMGKLVLDSNLELGSYRELTEKEIEILSEKALNEN